MTVTESCLAVQFVAGEDDVVDGSGRVVDGGAKVEGVAVVVSTDAESNEEGEVGEVFKDVFT